MKKIFSYALAAAALFSVTALTSCGGSKSDNAETETKEESTDSFKVKPEATRVNGPLSSAFEVVDKEYTFTKDGSMSYAINVDFKRTDASAPYDTMDIDDMYGSSDASMLAGIGLEMLDENGNVIFTVDPDRTDCVTLLRSVSGDTASVKFTTYDDIKGTPTSFRITSDLQPNKKSDSSSSSSSSSSLDEVADAAGSTLDEAAAAMGKALDDADLDDAIETAKSAASTAKSAAKAAKAAYDIYKNL